MKIYEVYPGALHFVAGCLASAAINMITSLAAEGKTLSFVMSIYISAAPWACAAVVLSWAAHLVEKARLDAEDFLQPTLTQAERREVLQTAAQPYVAKIRALFVITVAMIALGISSTAYFF